MPNKLSCPVWLLTRETMERRGTATTRSDYIQCSQGKHGTSGRHLDNPLISAKILAFRICQPDPRRRECHPELAEIQECDKPFRSEVYTTTCQAESNPRVEGRRFSLPSRTEVWSICLTQSSTQISFTSLRLPLNMLLRSTR